MNVRSGEGNEMLRGLFHMGNQVLALHPPRPGGWMGGEGAHPPAEILKTHSTVFHFSECCPGKVSSKRRGVPGGGTAGIRLRQKCHKSRFTTFRGLNKNRGEHLKTGRGMIYGVLTLGPGKSQTAWLSLDSHYLNIHPSVSGLMDYVQFGSDSTSFFARREATCGRERG